MATPIKTQLEMKEAEMRTYIAMYKGTQDPMIKQKFGEIIVKVNSDIDKLKQLLPNRPATKEKRKAQEPTEETKITKKPRQMTKLTKESFPLKSPHKKTNLDANIGDAFIRKGFGKVDDENSTPRDFLDELEEEFGKMFDPCPLGGAKLAALNPEKYDGRIIEWEEKNFVNPPFSDIIPWIKKALIELEKGRMSVFLVPSRMHSQYWFEYIFPNAVEIRILKRGLSFGKYKKPIPFPIVIVIFHPDLKPSMIIHECKTYTWYDIKNQFTKYGKVMEAINSSAEEPSCSEEAPDQKSIVFKMVKKEKTDAEEECDNSDALEEFD